MNKLIRIGNKLVGNGKPCFIIAEAGSNHDGNFKKAIRLIDIAVDAGADAVKFQTFKAKKMYTEKAGILNYIRTNKSIYQVVKEMEMPEEWIAKLAQYCKKKKIIFISTPCDEESVDLLNPYVPVFKIASYEMTHVPLIKYIASKGKPLIISTGAANMKEVEKLVVLLKQFKVKEYILMQCTASYPAKLEDINIRVISEFKKKFNIPIGLSDHSREFDIAPICAVALGSNVIEKHFTISNKLPGPDHQFAIEPIELKQMVKKIRATELSLGNSKKIYLKSEKYLRNFARRNIYAIDNIKKNEIFTNKNIGVLRRGDNGKGINPNFFEQVINKKAKKFIKKNEPINWNKILS